MHASPTVELHDAARWRTTVFPLVQVAGLFDFKAMRNERLLVGNPAAGRIEKAARLAHRAEVLERSVTALQRYLRTVDRWLHGAFAARVVYACRYCVMQQRIELPSTPLTAASSSSRGNA